MNETNPTKKIEFLILYGSLRFGQTDFHDLKLDEHLERVGNTEINGVLVDLGSYPGLILKARGRVYGELYRIKNDSVIAQLDEFERFDRSDRRPLDRTQKTGSLYIRQAIKLDDGSLAHIYEYNGELIDGEIRSGSIVKCGDWLKHRESQYTNSNAYS